MNIRRSSLAILTTVILITGLATVIFWVDAQEKLRQMIRDEAIPVDETPEEYQSRLDAEGDALLLEHVKDMSAFEAAEYLYDIVTPSHNDIFFEKIDQAIAEDPTAEALMLRGMASWGLRDDKKSAASDFARATEIDPTSREAQKEYANALWANGDFDAAIVEGKKAVELGSMSAYFIIQTAYSDKGEWKEALKYLQEGQKHFPDRRNIARQIEVLQSKNAGVEKR